MYLTYIGVLSLVVIAIILLLVAESHIRKGEDAMGYVLASIITLSTAIITLIITILWT
jgi:hypothetical protein